MSRYVADNTKNKIFLLTTGKKFSIEKDILSPSLTILRVPSLKIFSTYRIFMSDTFSVHYLYEILNSLNLDIIHSHSYSFLSYTVQNWCNSNDKPFIYTSHILPTKALSGKTETYINKGLKVPLNIYFTNFYKGCSSIIVLNKAFGDLHDSIWDIKSRHFLFRSAIWFLFIEINTFDHYFPTYRMKV